ncbi:tetratricopeptide repeat protein [Psychromonas sp. KJ10-10]|uniref:tetratricopeptide repeat protein n=1 Tax=Psychromonas sp. KJ10-10 TaxID=3391823 RepID=UPI0039B4AD21
MTKHNQKQPLYFLLLITLFVSWGASARQLTRGTAIKVQQAYELQSNEQFNEAITSLTAIKSQDNYEQAYVSRMLGWLYWRQKQPKLAIKHLTQAVDLKVLIEQDDLSTQRMLADILLTEGHYQQAESRYLTLVKAYHDSNTLMQLWLRVAQAQYQQEKWPEVEKSIGKQQAFRKKSKSPAQIMPLNILLTAQLAQKNGQQA